MWKPKITWPITWRPTLPFSSDALRILREAVLYVLLPDTCRCCKQDLPWKSRDPLCPACVAGIKTPGPLYCMRCGKPLPDGGAHCYHCRASKAKQFKCKIIRSAVVFGPQIRGVVHAFKYGGQPELAAYLAGWMYRQWKQYPDLADAQVLLPVPLHAKKLKYRGYNQSALLARELGLLCSLPVDTDSLVRQRNTPSQTEFGREGRLKNMSGAFVCVHPENIRGKTILLIDDVATTGATLECCAEALKSAGAKKVKAYTLAREI